MTIISFIFLVIVVAMLLHITLANLLCGIYLFKKGFTNSSKYQLIKTTISFVVLLIVLTINILLKDTNYTFVSNFINGFIIGWIYSDYYLKYL